MRIFVNLSHFRNFEILPIPLLKRALAEPPRWAGSGPAGGTSGGLGEAPSAPERLLRVGLELAHRLAGDAKPVGEVFGGGGEVVHELAQQGRSAPATGLGAGASRLTGSVGADRAKSTCASLRSRARKISASDGSYPWATR
jgi:hypothetical protein